YVLPDRLLRTKSWDSLPYGSILQSCRTGKELYPRLRVQDAEMLADARGHLHRLTRNLRDGCDLPPAVAGERPHGEKIRMRVSAPVAPPVRCVHIQAQAVFARAAKTAGQDLLHQGIEILLRIGVGSGAVDQPVHRHTLHPAAPRDLHGKP